MIPGDSVDVHALTPLQVQREIEAGALVVDVRTDRQFDDAHIPGAVCNPAVRAGFGTKLAWVADRDLDVVLVGRDDDDATHAAHLAASVGIRTIGGDVRERGEWDAGHIPGSVFTPYHDVHGIPEGIDRSRPVAVVCSSGQRSAVAASLLRRHGVEHVIHVADGGVGTWEQHGWLIER